MPRLRLCPLLPPLPSAPAFIRCPHGPLKTCRIRSSLCSKRQWLPHPSQRKARCPCRAWPAGARETRLTPLSVRPVPIDGDLLHLLSKSLLFSSPGCSSPDVLTGHTPTRLGPLLGEAFARHPKMACLSPTWALFCFPS